MLNRKRTRNVVGTSNAEVLGSSKCVLLVIQEIARVFPTKFIYIPFEVLPWSDQIHEIPGFEAVTMGSGKNLKWPPSAFQKQLARWPCLGYGESVAQTEAANPRLGRWLWSACTALERTQDSRNLFEILELHHQVGDILWCLPIALTFQQKVGWYWHSWLPISTKSTLSH